jgi:uncharacterized protein YkwD
MRRVSIGFGALLGSAIVLGGLLAPNAGAAAAASQDHAGNIERVLELTNGARQAAGLAALVFSPNLSDAAESYSQVLAGGTCFEHTCGGVPNFADRLRQAGYTGWSTIAENIAAGYPTPDAVVAGWMASPGHRANILSAEYHEVGVGVVSGGPYGTYWTQEFGTRAGDGSQDVAAAPDAEPHFGESD